MPYRCVECSHRFLAWDQRRIDVLRALVPAVTIVLVFGGLMVSAYLFAGDPETAAPPPEVENPDSTGATVVPPGLGFEVPEDRDQAQRLYQQLQQSAAQGDSEAMVQLGLMFKNGIGILQNYEQAARWIRTAAESGNPKGMLELARLYRDGVGYPTDFIQAYVWFNRAAAAFNREAVRERDDVARSLTPENLEKAQELSAQT